MSNINHLTPELAVADFTQVKRVSFEYPGEFDLTFHHSHEELPKWVGGGKTIMCKSKLNTDTR